MFVVGMTAWLFGAYGAGQVPVEEWRAGLWRRALADHGIDDDVLGTTLQRCFTSSRTRRFRFTTEVQVCAARQCASFCNATSNIVVIVAFRIVFGAACFRSTVVCTLMTMACAFTPCF